MKSKFLAIFTLVVASFLLILGNQGCGQAKWTKELPAGTQKYLAHNIWIEKEKIWSTGYQVGRLIPAGTKVKDIKFGKKSGYPTVAFTGVEDNQTYYAYFNPDHHPGISAQDYMDRLLTSQSFEEITQGLTSKEKKAIETGDVVPGMSKDAVLVSWGYPPETGTGSLDFDVWKFWKNRFDTIEVRFNDEDKVTEIRD
ncbi:MAG: hypothetical protein ACQES8_06500 [Thermodesulfobacteriota bacterium]